MSRHAARLAAACVAVSAVAACASEPPPRPPAAPRPAPVAARPRPKPVDRSAGVARDLGVDAARFVWSPGHGAFAIALPGAAAEAPHKLVVYGAGGDKRAELEAVRAGEIAELRFLGEDRLAYLAPAAPPAPPPRHKKAARAKPPLAPHTAYVVQPLSGGAAPIACEGRSFVFSPAGDHLAFVAGDPGHEHVGVDGAQVYPRSGATRVLGEPAWSRDGASLALIEGGAEPRLVVLVEFDNPNGDNTWPLPPQAADPTLHVFWAGAGNVVVGRELTRPVFATSFKRE
jgi:hypothetical protein